MPYINKKPILIIGFILFLTTGLKSQMVNTTAASVTAGAGTVNIPINITNLNGVAAISLVLEYNASTLTYNGYQNLNALLTSGMLIINQTGNKIITSWISTTPVNIGNGILYEITFTSNGGSSPLTWDTLTSGNCEYSDFNGNMIPALFIDGGITPGSMILDLKIYLEGPFTGTNMATHLNSNNLIPINQPYQGAPWNYNGSETAFPIPNPDVVDWALVELRDASNAASATPATSIARQAALLLNNGALVGVDGISNLQFTNSLAQQLFVVIYHRNHLSIMSANSLTASGGVYSYDYTTAASQIYGGILAVKELSPGKWGMIAADGNADGSIDIIDKNNNWFPNAGNSGYHPGDYDMNGQINNRDKNDFWVSNEGIGSQVPK